MEPEMEIVKPGSDELNAQDSLSCCWPPGTESVHVPEPE